MENAKGRKKATAALELAPADCPRAGANSWVRDVLVLLLAAEALNHGLRFRGEWPARAAAGSAIAAA